MKNPLILLLLATAAFAVSAQGAVKPPPLPPGSEKLRVEPGLNKQEQERHIRAHHHKGHHKKDPTRGSSADAPGLTQSTEKN